MESFRDNNTKCPQRVKGEIALLHVRSIQTHFIEHELNKYKLREEFWNTGKKFIKEQGKREKTYEDNILYPVYEHGNKINFIFIFIFNFLFLLKFRVNEFHVSIKFSIVSDLIKSSSVIQPVRNTIYFTLSWTHRLIPRGW